MEDLQYTLKETNYQLFKGDNKNKVGEFKNLKELFSNMGAGVSEKDKYLIFAEDLDSENNKHSVGWIYQSDKNIDDKPADIIKKENLRRQKIMKAKHGELGEDFEINIKAAPGKNLDVKVNGDDVSELDGYRTKFEEFARTLFGDDEAVVAPEKYDAEVDVDKGEDIDAGEDTEEVYADGAIDMGDIDNEDSEIFKKFAAEVDADEQGGEVDKKAGVAFRKWNIGRKMNEQFRKWYKRVAVREGLSEDEKRKGGSEDEKCKGGNCGEKGRSPRITSARPISTKLPTQFEEDYNEFTTKGPYGSASIPDDSKLQDDFEDLKRDIEQKADEAADNLSTYFDENPKIPMTEDWSEIWDDVPCNGLCDDDLLECDMTDAELAEKLEVGKEKAKMAKFGKFGK